MKAIVRILKYFKMFSSYIGISLQVNSFPFLLYTFVIIVLFQGTLNESAREFCLPCSKDSSYFICSRKTCQSEELLTEGSCFS